jgi:hypothetical protein
MFFLQTFSSAQFNDEAEYTAPAECQGVTKLGGEFYYF